MTTPQNDQIISPHSIQLQQLFTELKASERGLSSEDVRDRIKVYGANVLPVKPPPTILQIFLQQFLNPLIYILVLAAGISISLGDKSDSLFIFIVLLLNAVIGTIQEYGAEQSAQALKLMAASHCMVQRNGQVVEIDAEDLVPGDIVLVESGKKVPADLRLISSQQLNIDESLLTGESTTVVKEHDFVSRENTPLADRKNMAFTGSIVLKGRAKGIVVSTGLKTELGKIADSLIEGKSAKPPLLIRMEIFTKNIAIVLVFITIVMGGLLLLRGQSWHEVLMFTVALAVAAIPEGLPVAITISLAIASRKMAKRKVVVRRLPSVEALGSCTFIATDKTGTLTVNQQTVQKIAFPTLPLIHVEGTGLDLEGTIEILRDIDREKQQNLVCSIATAGTLCNESHLRIENGVLVPNGDTVDLSFLVLAHKADLNPDHIREQYKIESEIPFEAENQFAATLHSQNGKDLISIKGAFEKLLPMCDKMLTPQGEVTVEQEIIARQADDLAESGYRVLALAMKTTFDPETSFNNQLNGLTFLGLVGMIDPLRPETTEAIQSCHSAGIKVAMVTGDHPKTAFAISRKLGLAKDLKKVVTGSQLKSVSSEEEKGRLIEGAQVFARVEPQQKLEIVQHLMNRGSFLAVTGDGANDAPALKAANVGIAMGKSGTDIAKETSDLIITDDRFATIVSGIEEGRIAYNNIRKVIYLLISTGAAEIILFSLSLAFNTPLPLTAVHLLWLNLVTNGIQHVGLAFEPGEGDELTYPPRKPNEPVFDRLMLERIGLSALIMGVVTFFYFKNLLDSGMDETSARNITLLLMVLFENVMVGNCRSETKSTFKLNPLRNKILLFGTLGAQVIHIAALYTPGIKDVLKVSPVNFNEWIKLFTMALSVLAAIELYKKFRSKEKILN